MESGLFSEIVLIDADAARLKYNLGVAMAVRRICEVIVRDEKSILSVSSLMTGQFGIDDIYLSMPAIVGADGVEEKIPISLDEEEVEKLQNSAKQLKRIADSIEW